MKTPCFEGKETLTVRTLPDGFRDREGDLHRCTLRVPAVPSQNVCPAPFVQTKAGMLEAVNLSWPLNVSPSFGRTCAYMSLWTGPWTLFANAGVPLSISLWRGFSWTLLPIQTLSKPTKYPSVWLAGLCQVTIATQVLVNSHWEVMLNLAVGVFPQLKLAGLCFLYGGKGVWKNRRAPFNCTSFMSN